MAWYLLWGINMSNFFGYITLTPGTRSFANIGASGLSGVLIGNESGYTVTITLQGANTSRSLYPGLVDWFPIHPGFNGTIQIDPVALLANTSSWPGNYLQIDTFGLGEAPTGVYPLALSRTFNIGNMVNTAMGNATNLVNDANVAGTKIIEATPGTDLSSAVTLTNDGVLTIGNSTHPGSVSFDNAKITSDGSGDLTVVKALFTAGSLTRIKGGIASYAGFVPITVTHGLGATPDIVLVTWNVANSANDTTLLVSNYTSTTFTIGNVTGNLMGTGDKIAWLAIKF
jgi:hypothetical protein